MNVYDLRPMPGTFVLRFIGKPHVDAALNEARCLVVDRADGLLKRLIISNDSLAPLRQYYDALGVNPFGLDSVDFVFKFTPSEDGLECAVTYRVFEKKPLTPEEKEMVMTAHRAFGTHEAVLLASAAEPEKERQYELEVVKVDYGNGQDGIVAVYAGGRLAASVDTYDESSKTFFDGFTAGLKAGNVPFIVTSFTVDTEEHVSTDNVPVTWPNSFTDSATQDD